MNSALVKNVLEYLISVGVQDVCLCAGSRNAPFVVALESQPQLFRTLHFFEERCAAFFALGRIKRSGKPVAVITTSGTAAAELLPATMEAFYSGLPLILITADRPRAYRGTGAPQTADQVGLFGQYVSHCIDLEGEERLRIPLHLRNQPLHLNICFDEPLLEPQCGEIELNLNHRSPDQSYSQLPAQHDLQKIGEFLQHSKSPIAVVGGLSPELRESALDLLVALGIPTYCESLSGLREHASLEHLRIHSIDQVFQRAAQAQYTIDGLIRIGSVPTLRLWRDLEQRYSQLPVLSLSHLPFSGLGRHSELIYCNSVKNFDQACHEFHLKLKSWDRSSIEMQRIFIERDHCWKQNLNALLESEPYSEPGLFFALSQIIPQGSTIFLGNSLPIREWDLGATCLNRNYQMWGSRGVNGIDGQVSTFIGLARPGSENWAILGDLTTMYDLPGPWILPQLPDLQIKLVVVNNGGGKIFSRLFKQEVFQNSHRLGFKPWAEFWGLEYKTITQASLGIDSSLEKISQQNKISNQLIEIIPCEESTRRFWDRYAHLNYE